MLNTWILFIVLLNSNQEPIAVQQVSMYNEELCTKAMESYDQQRKHGDKQDIKFKAHCLDTLTGKVVNQYEAKLPFLVPRKG